MKRVFVLGYEKPVFFEIPVYAETEAEAKEAAKKLIDDGTFVPSEAVAYSLNRSWVYTEEPEVTLSNMEYATEEFGDVYSASEVLGGAR